MTHILLSILLSVAAFAHDKPAFELNFAKQNVQLNEESMQSLIKESVIHQSHEIVEGDESGPFWLRWIKAADLKGRVVDGVRWASSVPEGTYRNLAIDSLFLFGLSHTLEMSSGPILLGIGYTHEWPNWVLGAIATGGTLISFPGLDPLCMFVFAAYGKSETFRNGVGWLRLASLKGIGKFARLTGLNDYVAKLFARPALRPYLESLEGLQSITGGEEGSLDFNYSLAGVDLTVHLENEKAYLEKITITGTPDLNLLRPFGWNTRDLVRTLARKPETEKPYLTRSGDSYQVAARAVPVRAKEDCEIRLQSHSGTLRGP